MSDLAYLSLILLSFGALLGYVHLCQWAGSQDADAPAEESTR